MKIQELRKKLNKAASDQVIPTMKRYGLDGSTLQSRLLWKPTVLILGNYSSGKSTLINEMLGGDVQQTGQAPTDDSFTVLTSPESGPVSESSTPELVETRTGAVVLNDETLPFQGLKKHGRAFASHFKLKRVSSPVLNDLVLIDSPGMLDSVTERDRGYEYSEVVGEMAKLVDMVLYVFDPHKAGTIRESFNFLREVLPGTISEDRVLFVVNRVDECSNLNDLLRVYGTLCWNLSQMTGRKDIPPIYVTWSEQMGKGSLVHEHLTFLDNQREQVKKSILNSPKNHVDHLVEDFERSAKMLIIGLDILTDYAQTAQKLFWKLLLSGIVIAAIVAAAGFFGSSVYLPELALEPLQMGAAAGGAFAVVFVFWWLFVASALLKRQRMKSSKAIVHHEVHSTPESKELWLSSRARFAKYCAEKQKLPLHRIRKDSKATKALLQRILKSAHEEE